MCPNLGFLIITFAVYDLLEIMHNQRNCVPKHYLWMTNNNRTIHYHKGFCHHYVILQSVGQKTAPNQKPWFSRENQAEMGRLLVGPNRYGTKKPRFFRFLMVVVMALRSD